MAESWEALIGALLAAVGLIAGLLLIHMLLNRHRSSGAHSGTQALLLLIWLLK
jgi:hypothetical protein